MPNDASGRYGPGGDAAYQGFHTYATSDLYDTNGGVDRWPDNWAGRQATADDDDTDEDDTEPGPRRDYWPVILWTMGWFAVPAIVLGVRAILLSNVPGPQCVAAGLSSCRSPRAEALGDLIANAPLWCFALVAAMILAVILRWASDSWRAATIGFCAAVVSGGALTVLYRIW